jgi:DNA modification methylase
VSKLQSANVDLVTFERMQTFHKLHFSDSRSLKEVQTKSVDLVLTSPPYPMIQMWDRHFSRMNPKTKDAIAAGNGRAAFELMHEELDKTWREVARVLKNGGIVCVNIGDATRSLNGIFQLFNNQSHISQTFEGLGFHALPRILWRKQTNKPNKYMGSGTLPVGAYVTLEHEWILIFRKDGPRGFEGKMKWVRRRSAFFWEERNAWFSDVWEDVKGAAQGLKRSQIRRRSAAFPFEVAYRLINMYSIIGDTVLDPFLGTGTTTLAALTCARNSVGYEIDRRFKPVIMRRVADAISNANKGVAERLRAHQAFVERRISQGKKLIHRSKMYGFPVVSRQEVDIGFLFPARYRKNDGTIQVEYSEWKA